MSCSLGIWVSSRVLWVYVSASGRSCRPWLDVVSRWAMAAWDSGWDFGSPAVGGCSEAVPSGRGCRWGGSRCYPVYRRRWFLLALLLIGRLHYPLWFYVGVRQPDYLRPVLLGRRVVLDPVVVVVRVCRLRVAPWHLRVQWHGLVVVVGVSVVHMMVWCGQVRSVGWSTCRPRLCWGGLIMVLRGPAVVLGHREARAWSGRHMLVLLLLPHSLALRERQLHAARACEGGGPSAMCTGWSRCSAGVLRHGGCSRHWMAVAGVLPWGPGRMVVRCGFARVSVGRPRPVGGRVGGPLGPFWASWPCRRRAQLALPVPVGMTGRWCASDAPL